MNAERWREVDRIFQDALEREPRDRVAFLDLACTSNSLRKEVEDLLRSHEVSDSFLGPPAVTSASRVFAGQVFGSYEIKTLIGSGGMGEVYLARDSVLKRDVAIKILPALFARDIERIARFQREAEVLASLNHPHIAAIYDLVQHGESRFIVLELVSGETLADRIAKGPIPVEAALTIAKQIAEALAAAHEKGIIHRDLKPANVKITSGGAVKVLDFGLAKVRVVEGTDLSDVPAKVTASAPGMFFGTAAYMPPERAKGMEADRTSDVWAFGCLLYEMLAGHAAFEGRTVGEILEAVFKSEPDWRRLPAETPEGIRRLLRRCLQKDPRLRFHDMVDVGIEIDEAQYRPPTIDHTAPVSPRRERLAWIAALAIVTVITVMATEWAFRSPPDHEMRLQIVTPPTADPLSLALAPDGSKVVFVATSDGRSYLWQRSLESGSMQLLTGTEGAALPFWSPSSESVGFFAGGKLKTIDIESGSVATLLDVDVGYGGGAWSGDGTILFSAGVARLIYRISASGGERSPVTRVEPPQQIAHSFPQFLPDNDHFLYYVAGAPEARGVYLGQLDGSKGRRLFDADSAAVYAASGQLLFVRKGTLLAQNFDVERLSPIGNPYPLAEQVLAHSISSQAAFSISAVGSIAYRTGPALGVRRQFIWLDRSGKEIRKVGDPDGEGALFPSMSPNGRTVALQRSLDRNVDIWLLDIERGVLNRFTDDPAIDSFPVWAPDGAHIAFSSTRKLVTDLFLKAATGAEKEVPLLETAQTKLAMDWSRDGRFLLYMSLSGEIRPDLWALPMDGSGKRSGEQPIPVAQSMSHEGPGAFSPDGKWVAYQSDETGRFEIYIQPFPAQGKKKLISKNGGVYVSWSGNGEEVFYIAPDEWLMAVKLQFASNGKTVEPGEPIHLFPTHVGGVTSGLPRAPYLVSHDGQRFLMNTVIEASSDTTPIEVILNWQTKP